MWNFKHFAVYRGTTSGFDASAMEPIATPTEASYVDADVVVGNTYYYRISTSDFSGNASPFSSEISLVVTSVQAVDLVAIPDDFVLSQNYPNPFNPSTEITFGLPAEASVRLVVYNILGEKIRTLANSSYGAGHYRLVWDGFDDNNRQVAPGMYLYRLEAGATVLTKKMMLIK